MSGFSQLPLPAVLLSNLDSLGYHHMTPIQALSLPPILAGHDLIAQAETGSGKTAAFGLGLLNALDTGTRQVQALVLCPTRELAEQVGKEIRRLARGMQNVKLVTLCGGSSLGLQIATLQHGAHIVVGTPGRIQKHLQKGSLDLHHLRTLVLDEADRMLDMGFVDDISAIIKHSPDSRQTLLFSATYPDAIQQISQRFQRNPQRVSAEPTRSTPSIEQHFFETCEETRDDALLTLLAHYQPEAALIFCNTKRQCDDVTRRLQHKGYHAQALHGDLEQRQRNDVLVQFSNQSCKLLVATDVAARGLDIDDLPLVINFQLSPDPQVHTHRIGRTGRAGKNGLALSLFTPAEAHRLSAIEAEQDEPVRLTPLDSLRPRQKTAETNTASMVTLQISGGRKDKLRPGDILGALTRDGGIP
ncbi:MAG TPA: ATP-dependent RNA helicase DbpA, partial [Chromatiales bacterium]|nr:ATP-dependent RNA helicase DbpA [Chromatiales bacterium]HEX21940.1 ATP-dependent RNA helicase DbpA [Chromatiales bacterium]